MRYRDKWTDVPDSGISAVDSDEYVGNMKSELDNIWEGFIAYTQTRPEMCYKGRIVDKRPPSPIGKGEELRRKAKIDALTNFDENYVSIGNLEEANRAIIQEWDAVNFGDRWGDGCGWMARSRFHS